MNHTEPEGEIVTTADPTPGSARPARLQSDTIATVLGIALLCIVAIPRIITTPPWIDEAYTAAAVNDPIQSIRFSHFTMSGYYIILWLWSGVGASFAWLRTFSLICAVLTIVCVRRIAVVVGGRRLATVTVIVLPLLAMFQWKATEARAYALETLVVTWLWLVAMSTARTSGRRSWFWVALAVAGVFGEFLHGLFFLQYIPLAVYLIWSDPRRTTVAKTLIACALAFSTAAGLWMTGASDVGTFLASDPGSWVASYLRTFFGHSPIVVLVSVAAVSAAAFLALRRRVEPGDREPRIDRWVPALWFAAPAAAMFAMSLAVNRFNPRYLAPTLPGLALLLAQVGTSLDRHLRRATKRSAGEPRPRVIGARLGSIGVVVAVAVGSVSTPPFVESPWREMASRVAAVDPSSNCIIFAEVSDSIPAQMRTPFETAWDIYETNTPLRVISSDRPLGKPRRADRNLPPTVVANRASACETVWILSDPNYGVDPSARFLEVAPLSTGFTIIDEWTTSDGYELVQLRRR